MARSGSRTTFVDAQFVVALINQRDQHHAAATELSAQFVGKPLITTDLVLVEIANALARNFRTQAAAVIDHFRQASNIETVLFSSLLFDEALSIYRTRPDKMWGMTDCVSFAVMRREGLSDALTYDQHFTQAGFHALLRSG